MNTIKIQGHDSDRVIINTDTKEITVETKLRQGLDKTEVTFRGIEVDTYTYNELIEKYEDEVNPICFDCLSIVQNGIHENIEYESNPMHFDEDGEEFYCVGIMSNHELGFRGIF